PPGAVVEVCPLFAARALDHRRDRQRRHVARALRDRRHEPAPGLSALLLGDVHPDGVRLGDLHRHDRVLRGALLPLHPLPAHDLHLRDAHARAGGGDGPGEQGMTQRPVHLYGVIAEFDNPGDLIAAARRAREAGYRKLDAYTPYPIHELTEALALPRTRLPIIVFAGGALGFAAALGMQWFAAAVHYPLNIGG